MAKENRGSNKSDQAKKQSADRLAEQQRRGSAKFGSSNTHNGATVSQSGAPPRKK